MKSPYCKTKKIRVITRIKFVVNGILADVVIRILQINKKRPLRYMCMYLSDQVVNIDGFGQEIIDFR